MTDPKRKERVHVANVRSHSKDGVLRYSVVLSDPVVPGGPEPDTWEVSWERWVQSGGKPAEA